MAIFLVEMVAPAQRIMVEDVVDVVEVFPDSVASS